MSTKFSMVFLSAIKRGVPIATSILTLGIASFIPNTIPKAQAKGEECVFESPVAGLGLVSLRVSPSVVEGRRQPQGEVVLSGPAPAGGAVVFVGTTFSGANPGYCVVVPAGETSQTFSIFTYRRNATSVGKIFANYGDTFLEAELTVTP